MGNVLSEVSTRVASLSLEDLKRSYAGDLELISYTDQLYDPAILQANQGFDVYKVSSKPLIKPVSDCLEQEISYAFSHTTAKQKTLTNSLISQISSSNCTSPLYEVFQRRLQALCGIYEGLLKQDRLKERLLADNQISRSVKSTLPIPAQLGINFGVSSLLLMMKRCIKMDPEMFTDIVNESIEILSQLPPMSYTVEDPVIEKAMEKASGFFESALKGEIRGVTIEMQLTSISPLLGIALVTGNVVSAFSIVLKFLSIVQDKGFNSVFRSITPLVRALSKVATSRKIGFLWESGEGVTISEDKSSASGVQDKTVVGERFLTGVRYYEISVEKLSGSLKLGIRDGDNAENTYWYCSDGSISMLQAASSAAGLAVNDHIGILVDFPNSSLAFYKNKALVAGPTRFSMTSALVYCAFAGESSVKFISPDLPDNFSGEVNVTNEGVSMSPVFSGLLQSESEYLDSSRISPQLLGAFLLACIEKNNEKHRLLLEKEGKSASVKAKEMLSLDVRQQSLEYLHLIVKTALSSKFNPELSRIVLQSGINLIRSHLFASRNFPNVLISREFKLGLYETLQEIYSGKYDMPIKKQAGRTISQFFELFFTKAEDQQEFLISLLKNYKTSMQTSTDETSIIGEMIQIISHPISLFNAFALENNEDTIKNCMSLLLEISSSLSLSPKKNKSESKIILALLNASLTCLISQFAASNFESRYQSTVLTISTMLLSSCSSLYESLAAVPDLKEAIKDTMLHSIASTFFTSLILCKLELPFITEILTPAFALLNSLRLIESRMPEITEYKSLQNTVYESEHPYPNSCDSTYTVKVPYALRYLLTFDSNCNTEANCDTLKLYSDETKANLSYTWSGTGFPTAGELEVKAPALCFEFHSDGSVNNWGYKVTIKTEIISKTYKSHWPSDLVMSLSMFISTLCKKLITFDFESSQDIPDLSEIIESPLCKYGIKDKILGLFPGLQKTTSLPESLTNLAGGRPTQSTLTGLNKKLMHKESLKDDLYSYTTGFGFWPRKYSDTAVVEELIVGSDYIIGGWRDLKQAAGIKGPASTIGGTELNQAERAVFAVYISLFDITEIVSNIFGNIMQVGNSVRYMVKQACNIRTWAQKRKQELIDSGKIVGYADIGADIVEKCALLLNSEHRKGILEVGVKSKLSEVTEAIKSSNVPTTVSNRWKTVKSAIAAIQKLSSLLSIVKPRPRDTDVTEISKIWNILMVVLNSKLTVEEIIKSCENRRVRGLSRALGFRFFHILSADFISCELLEVFSQCCYGKEGKVDITKGLEAIDPALIRCSQSEFYLVYKIFMRKLSEFNPESLFDLYMLLNLIESLNYPILESDLHYFLDFNVGGLIRKLLEWAKGNFCNLKVSKIFSIETCVTSFKLLTSPEPNTLEVPEAESMYLQCITGEAKLPISEIKWSGVLLPDYEDTVGPITVSAQGDVKYILVKRSQAAHGHKYLAGMNPGLEANFQPYSAFFTQEDSEEKLKCAQLKQNISEISFAFLKLLMTSLSLDSLQETIVHEFFKEFTEVKASFSLSLDETCRGNTWIGKINVPTSLQRNPMDLFLKKLYKEASSDLPVRKIIEGHVRIVDSGLKGALLEEDEAALPESVRKRLGKHPEFRNSKNQIDFFSYLQSIVEKKDELDPLSAQFLSTSPLFQNLPIDFYDASSRSTLANISYITSYALSQSASPEFTAFLTCFLESETPGLSKSGEFPEEFKNPEGSYDLYLAINKISSDQEKFAVYYTEVQKLLQEFGAFPTSCLSLNTEQILIEDYQGTLLWLIYSQCSHSGVLRALSRNQRVADLLAKAISGSQELSALAMLILSCTLPSQHSFESLEPIWRKIHFPAEIPKTAQRDLLKYFLFQLGNSVGFYMQRSSWASAKRNSADSLELLRKLVEVPRWKEKLVEEIKATVVDLNRKLEAGEMISEVDAGALAFLAMNGNYYSGIDCVLQPLSRVKLESACVGEGIAWVIGDESCKIFSLESEAFHNESTSKITKILSSSDFYKDLQEPGLFELLLKTWSLIQAFKPSPGRTAAKAFLGNKLVVKRAESLVLESLVTMSNIKQGISRAMPSTVLAWKRFLAVKENIARIMEGKAKAEITKQMTPEEIQTRITGLDEKRQILMTEVASLGYPNNLILAALDSGCSTLEEIIDNILGGNTKSLFALSKWADGELEIIDLTENGIFYQSSKGHMVISTALNSQDKKVYSKIIEDKVFHDSKWFIEDVTIFIAISATTAQHKCEYGLKIGELDIKFESIVENTQIDISGKFSVNVPTQASYVLKIFAAVSGEVEVVGENFTLRCTLAEASVFTGYRLGSLSLYLKEGNRVELKGFSVFEGRLDRAPKFFEEDMESKEMQGRFIKVMATESGMIRNRLGQLGLPESVGKSLSEQYYDLEKCIQEALRLDSTAWPNPFTSVQLGNIYSLKLYNTATEIEKGYEAIPVLENGEPSRLGLNNHRVLAMKRISDSNSKKLSEISIEEVAGGELLGDLAQDPTQDSLKLYDLYSEKANCIKSLAFIVSRSSQRVGVPSGYQLLSNKEGSAINFSTKNDKGFYLFLAYTIYDYILGSPVHPLSTMGKTGTGYGLLNTSKSKTEDSEETMAYANLSLLELISTLVEQEELRIQKSGKDFMMSISALKPEALVASAENKGFTYLLNMFGEDYKELEPFLGVAVRGNHKSIIDKIVCECIYQLVTAGSGTDVDGKAKVYESAHSYANNLDTDEDIYFPGAKKLIFEFDPQCYTEANCDYVEFFKAPGRNDLFKKYSGQGASIWEKFEYSGDRLYMHFHTDSSVAYWGYKFTVTPVLSKRKQATRKYNIPAILFIVDYFAKRGYNFAYASFFKKEVLLPLFMLMHTNDSTEIIEQCVGILGRLVQNLEDYQVSMLDLLLGQATIMHGKISEGPNSLLTVILSMLCTFYNKKTYKIKERWFIDFYNCFYDMKDLSEPSNSLVSFLFECFKDKLLKSVEKSYESTHPYSREPRTEHLSLPGATSLEVIFDPSSTFDEGDEIYFSSDSDGKVAISGSSTNTRALTWSTTTKGPDIAISNNGQTVTRTSSSGWGVAQGAEIISGVCLTITISIDNMDEGAYWYIGLVDPSETINYTTNLANDTGFKLWTWKKSGEFMRKGEQVVKGAEFGFAKGDVIQIVVNCPESKVSFLKNGDTMHTFPDLSERTSLAMSFGGSNQIGTIISATEEGSSISALKKRKLKISGDSAYFHFPINQGIYDNFSWESTNEPGISMSPYSLSRTSIEGPTVHLTANSLTTGRHYCEFEFVSLPDKSLAVVCIVRESVPRSQSVVGSCVGYKSLGGVMVGANNTACKGFKAGEAIGLYVDFNKCEVKFYKNKLLVSTNRMDLIVNENYRVAVMLTVPGQELKIVTSPKPPEDVDLLGVRQQIRYGHSGSWGYKFKVVPVFSDRSPETVEQVLKYSNEEDKRAWKEYLDRYSGIIRSGAAEEVVVFVDEVAVASGKPSLDLQNTEINPQPSTLIYYPSLEVLQVREIQELCRVFQGFNARVKSCLGMFDLHVGEAPTDIQKAFFASRKYIFFDIKNTIFTTNLQGSKSDLRAEIVIDRTKAMRCQQQGKVDVQGQFSVFGQVLRCMNQRDNTEFRNSERVFKVSYKGEGAIDAGGPYNEVLSNICDELQSSYLPLLTSTQNHLNNVGAHRDGWVLNSQALQAGHELFTFLGKLIGVAIRTQNNLNLSLAPLAWKHIVVDSVDLVDLKGVDEVCFQMIEILRNLEAKGINKDNFTAAFSDEFFTTRLTNGDIVELVPGGKSLQVSYEKAVEYAGLVAKARIGEAGNWYKAIRKGISAVIPIDLLNLFSWKQVETLACGAGDIKVDILRANTEYTGGTNESDPHIAFFWEVLTEMNPKEKQLFLRFVWGRSRLPASKTFTHMKISKLAPRGPVDKYLPVSHTCFFTIDLPPYNSKEVMKEKILYAITHCTAIDLDTTPTAGGWEEND